jgi:dTDP-L-rhamnose 4-epimerase
MSLRRVLVTGGAGFIGSHLVDRLLREGFQVRVLDSLDSKIHPKGRPKSLASEVEFVHGDVLDRNVLIHSLQGVEIVFHQAAYQDYMKDFCRFVSTNASATALMYELIVQYGLKIKKLVVASSQAVYGEGQYQCAEHGFFMPSPRSQQQLQCADWEVHCPRCGGPATPQLLREDYSNPFNQYAVSKLAQEKIALGLGWLHEIPTVALRYSITQGPRQSLYNQYSGICRIFFSQALKDRPLTIYEDGQQTRDFVHVQDVVDANLLVLEKDAANFQSFNVGSGQATTVLEYADLVRKKTGSCSELHIAGEYRRGDNRHSVSNIEKLSALGWRPKRDLSTILDDFYTWVEAIGGIPEGLPDAHEEMKRAGVVVQTR